MTARSAWINVVLVALLATFLMLLAAEPPNAAAATSVTPAAKECKNGTDRQIARTAAMTPASVRSACMKPAGLTDTIKKVAGSPGDALDTIKSAPGAIGDAMADAAKSAVVGTLDEMGRWWGQQCGKAVKWVTTKLVRSNKTNVTGPNTSWFSSRYGEMVQLAVILSTLMVVISILSGILRAETAGMAKAVLINWPAAFFLIAVLLACTQLGVEIIDDLTRWVLGRYDADIRAIGTALGEGLGVPGLEIAGMWVTMLLGVVAMVGALLIWVELLIRDGCLYLVVLTAPLFAVVSIWPPAKSVIRKLLALLAMLVVAPFFIVLVFGFGAHLVAATSNTDLTRLFAGAIIMFLAACTPMILLRLLPFDELGEAATRPHMPVAAQMQMSQTLSNWRAGSKQKDERQDAGGGGRPGGEQAPDPPGAGGGSGGGGGPAGGGPSGGGKAGAEGGGKAGAGGGGKAAGGSAGGGGAGSAAGGAAMGVAGAAAGVAAAGIQRAYGQTGPAADGATTTPGAEGAAGGDQQQRTASSRPTQSAARSSSGARNGFGGGKGPASTGGGGGAKPPASAGGGSGAAAAAK